jgi:hypothetical protein
MTRIISRVDEDQFTFGKLKRRYRPAHAITAEKSRSGTDRLLTYIRAFRGRRSKMHNA